MNDTILQAVNIQKYYGSKENLTKAVDRISFQVKKGEFLGIMGTSGSGKTTLLNCISTIDTVTGGHIYVEGKDITKLKGSELAAFRGKEAGIHFPRLQSAGHTDCPGKYLPPTLRLRDQTGGDQKKSGTDRRVTEYLGYTREIPL